MRIHLKIRSTGQVIPFNHQHMLTGVIHKWIGENKEHGNVSLYCFSKLEGGKAQKDGLIFKDETKFFFSSVSDELIKKIIEGVREDPTMFLGLAVAEIIIQEDPDFTHVNYFRPASPIFIKKKEGEKIQHILYDNPLAGNYLTDNLRFKMSLAGLEDESLHIEFDANFPNAGTKKITYRNIENRANWCAVKIDAKPETKLFAWNVGLGNSTGIGFGAIV